MKKLGPVLILAAQTVVLCVMTLLCVLPLSCKLTEEGIIFIGGDYSTPVIEEFTVLDDRNVMLSFSKKIKLKSYIVSEQIKDISDSDEHSESQELSPAIKAANGGFGKIDTEYSVSEDGCILTFTAADQYEVGKAYEVFGTVEDKTGNSLTFCVPFCGFNSNLPKLVMTEAQIKYKKYKDDAYRCEFIEFLALTDGNLSGLEIVSAADGEEKKYCFPVMDVSAGEIFIVHLRTAGSGCVNETDNLNASSAPHSGKNVRDIWSENTKARLSDNSDIIVLRNGVDGTILDALMYVSEDTVEWGSGLAAMAEEVVSSGIYESCAVDEVELNTGLGTVAQKSFCRKDASELLKLVKAGSEIEYPVKRKEENWVVKNVTPGTL